VPGEVALDKLRQTLENAVAGMTVELAWIDPALHPLNTKGQPSSHT